VSRLKVEFAEFDDERSVRGRPDALLVEFAEVLRANPGRWGKWPRPLKPSSAGSYAARINRPSKYPDAQPIFRDGFEARTRKSELFVRYTGEDNTA
jgi:hypothetical protein